MQLSRVEGHVTATRKHPSLAGWRLALCQPVDAEGQPEGTPVVAIDGLGAGLHSRVVISSDGAAARAAVNDAMSPVRMMIVALVDDLHTAQGTL